MLPRTPNITAKDAIAAINRPSDPIEEGYPELLDVSPLARQFNAYAGPSIWGPWQTIASNFGAVTYEISYEALGDTLVTAQVRYWKGAGSGNQVTEDFRDSVTITTADCIANVEVRFRGVPTGSAVRGTVNP